MEAAHHIKHQRGIIETARGNEEAKVIDSAWAKVRHAARKAKQQVQAKGKGGAKRMREVHEAMRIDQDVSKVKKVAREIKAAERASASAQVRVSKIDTDKSDEDADKSIGSWHKKRGADSYHGFKLAEKASRARGAKAPSRHTKTAAVKVVKPSPEAKPSKEQQLEATQREARINSGWKKILKSKVEIKKALHSESQRKHE